MNRRNESSIKGNNNIVNQFEKQINIYTNNGSNEYFLNEYSTELLKETVEDEENPIIIYFQTLDGRTIQCGNGRFSVESSTRDEREMSCWEEALRKLEEASYIQDINGKKEVFKVTKKGYDYYDNYIKEK